MAEEVAQYLKLFLFFSLHAALQRADHIPVGISYSKCACVACFPRGASKRPCSRFLSRIFTPGSVWVNFFWYRRIGEVVGASKAFTRCAGGGELQELGNPNPE